MRKKRRNSFDEVVVAFRYRLKEKAQNTKVLAICESAVRAQRKEDLHLSISEGSAGGREGRKVFMEEVTLSGILKNSLLGKEKMYPEGVMFPLSLLMHAFLPCICYFIQLVVV